MPKKAVSNQRCDLPLASGDRTLLIYLAISRASETIAFWRLPPQVLKLRLARDRIACSKVGWEAMRSHKGQL